MKTSTILYIEDDQEIGSWSRDFLIGQGYEVIWKTSGHGAEVAMEHCDLVVLDIMLPGLDGFTVGQRLKRINPAMPILLLTARTAIEDKLAGLTFADDYITKPFHPDELAARIQVLLRRTGAAETELLQIRHLTIDRKESRLWISKTRAEIVLTGKQFHIFMYFLDHLNHILTQKQIYEAVWGEPHLDGDKTLTVHIRHLREKIELDSGFPKIIETIRGVGYRVRS
ncbi:response regulator transcription factor [Paenibacillus nasutitermitis]|uniref:DNA-binding response regulator n=1 Tax=Paenibacillus nasutitermitis TaxID=1652958 RepID=A0A916ZI21_9BACL|nr:response regulator transcription factor [Paenibacillus nasutitermitis]GGD97407.1 DNA-binding response regulator [Paenibacillus nasutitermitis]